MRIDPTLYHGRPAGRRIDKEERCYALLDSLGMDYERADHDHADTIEDCRTVEALLGCEICKNLLLTNRQMTALYLLESLDLTPGSVSVLGLMNDREGQVKLLIDRDLLRQECIGFHPCINSSTVKLRTADLLEKLLPAMGHAPQFVELPWDPDAET